MSDLLKATAHESLVHNVQIRTVTPSPAAGADFVIPVPSGEDWRILGIRATLVTSAVVANRTPSLAIDDQTNIGNEFPSLTVIPASQTVIVIWSGDASYASTAVVGGKLIVPIPLVVLPTAYRARSITNLIDVADQWSAITVMIERIDEPPFRGPMVGTAFDDEVEHELSMQQAGG